MPILYTHPVCGVPVLSDAVSIVGMVYCFAHAEGLLAHMTQNKVVVLLYMHSTAGFNASTPYQRNSEKIERMRENRNKMWSTSGLVGRNNVSVTTEEGS